MTPLDIEVVWEWAGGRILTQGYGWAKAHCPIHEDRNASAQVNREEGKWRCFTCDLYGDGYDLIQEMERAQGRPSELADAKRIAEGIPGALDGHVPESARFESGLVPRRQGNRQGRRNWSPPWKSL